jgi:hypothetical protein
MAVHVGLSKPKVAFRYDATIHQRVVYVDVPWPVTPDFDICGIEDLFQLFFAEVVNHFMRMKFDWRVRVIPEL